VTERNLIANLKLSASANAGLDYETTMAESGLTYEVARWDGARSSTALDVLGGARYWNQELDLSLTVDASVDAGNLGLKRSGSRAVGRSGTSNGSTLLSVCACATSWRQGRSFNSSAMSAALVLAAISRGSSLAAIASISRCGRRLFTALWAIGRWLLTKVKTAQPRTTST
jgi:hypothetical protein